ncbi:hypothetical protein CRUP_018705 [Coryphaenoides rupestris]|nr:hypothetical protein CRUP_018705 [Coryphaenoides rupestris]
MEPDPTLEGTGQDPTLEGTRPTHNFIKDLVNETSVRRYGLRPEEWQVSLIWSFLVSIFCIGGLLGSPLAEHMSKRYGRKQCLLLNNVVAVVAAVLMLFSERALSFEMIMVARFLYGINTGVSINVHPMYLVECAPKSLRGLVGVTTATFASLGKFTGQLLGIRGAAALLQLFTLPLLPESPRYLLLSRRDHQAYDRAIKRLWGSRDYSVDTQEMLQESVELQGVKVHSVADLLLSRSMRWTLIAISVLFTSMQMSGINAVYFYSLDVFKAAGIPEGQLRYVVLGMGMCEVIASVCCAVAVGSIGRKTLLFGGFVALGITQTLLTIALYMQSSFSWLAYCSILLVFLSIFFFSAGPAGVSMSLLGEVFPHAYKPAGFTVACSINWLFLFLVGMLFPLIVTYLHSFCFVIFLVFTAATAAFVWFHVPETNGLSALEIAEAFRKMHTKAEKPGGPPPGGPAANRSDRPLSQTKL